MPLTIRYNFPEFYIAGRGPATLTIEGPVRLPQPENPRQDDAVRLFVAARVVRSTLRRVRSSFIADDVYVTVTTLVRAGTKLCGWVYY